MRTKLTVEQLESRCAMSVLTVGPGERFATIQDGVNAASPGDTVKVDSGTYNESVYVRTPGVVIDGAKAGLTPWTPTAILPSIVQGPAGHTAFFVFANDVTISGLTVQNAWFANNVGAGIYVAPGVSGTHVTDDLIQHSIVGLFIANTISSDPAVVSGCCFRNNDRPGPASGSDIYADNFTAGSALCGVLIQGNRFTNTYYNENSWAVGFANIGDVEWTNITVLQNTAVNGSDGFYFMQCANVHVTANTLVNCDDYAIAFLGACHNCTVTYNNVSECALGVLVEEDVADNVGNVLYNTGISVYFNNIYSPYSEDQAYSTDVPIYWGPNSDVAGTYVYPPVAAAARSRLKHHHR